VKAGLLSTLRLGKYTVPGAKTISRQTKDVFYSYISYIVPKADF